MQKPLVKTDFQLKLLQHNVVSFVNKVEFFVRIYKTAGMSDTRLTHVESTLAFQEKTISDLSDVMFRQQEEIDRLKAHVKEITDRMTQDEDDLAGGGLPANEKPPHY